MEKMTAFCGLDCENCNARIATVNDDDALRAKTAKFWSKLNGIEISKDMINCDGCRVNGIKTYFCEKLCQIRQCAMKNGFETCGDCAQMEECEKLKPVFNSNLCAKNNLKKA